MKKRIVIVDDHASIRDMLACVLRRETDYEIIGTAGTGLEAVDICATLKPDMVILDLILPELSGVEVIRRLSAILTTTRILIYTGAFNRSLVIDALKCRPHGFVHKSDTLQALRDAMSVVAGGGCYFTESSACFLNASMDSGPEESDLTSREREILQLVAEGRSSKEISRRLGVATKTVENHRFHLMRKIGVRDVASLTRYAVSNGIVAA